MSLTLGSRVGQYEIRSLIGAGGMGEVYRARDTKLNRDVALKVLPDSFANDPDRLARFQREAQVLASLNHPNIAHIHGLEDSGGVRALVMEMVDGEDLAQRLTRGAIPIDEALPIAKQIAEALEAAHEQGIVHRDLKPANIKVRPDGTVKVLDFGLAKALDSAGAASSSVSMSPTITSPAMTQAGIILGTAAYMSPEQARGKPIDTRTDVWAFGCVLFEMLAGQRAFDGELISDVLAAILKTDPNWQAMPAGTPPALRRLVGRCLEKDPKRRLQAIGEVRVQIEDLLTGASEPIGPVGPSGERLWPRLALVAVLALAIGAAGAFTATRRVGAAAPRVTRMTLAAIGPAALTINGISRDLAISPDGSRVVYVGNNGTQLFVRALDALEPVAIATGQIREPFVSPDGQWVGFIESLNNLKKVPISGGPSIHLATLDGAPQGATWLADDTIVFGTNNQSTGLQRVSANGGTPTVLTRPDHQHGEVDHLWPEILPGGRVALYTITAQIGGPDNASIAALDLTTQTSTILVRGGVNAYYVADGHLVYLAAGMLRAVPFDLRKLTVLGPAVPVVPRLVTTGRGDAGDFAVATDGTLVYVDLTPGSQSSRARTLVWVDRMGKEEQIPAEMRAYEGPSISPDGKLLALAITDQEADIWLWDLARAQLKRLTFEPGVDTLPVWTPDSHRIVFGSQSGGSLNLWWQGVDFKDTAERLTTSVNSQSSTSVSSDGTQVVFSELTPTMGQDLMKLSLGGTRRVTPVLQTPFDELSGAISPNGHWLAYETNSSGQFEIWVRPFPDTLSAKHPISRSGGARPVWAHSGKELFFFGGDGALMRVPVDATATMWNNKDPMKLLEPRYYTGNGNPNRSYDVSSDDQRFLMIKSASADPTTVPPSIVVVQHFDEELKRTARTK